MLEGAELQGRRRSAHPLLARHSRVFPRYPVFLLPVLLFQPSCTNERVQTKSSVLEVIPSYVGSGGC